MKRTLRKRKNARNRIISLVLSLTLIVTGLNVDVINTSVKADESSKTKIETSKQKEKATVVKELKNERTENTNTYLLSDGSKKLAISSEDLRYKENGELVDYNPSLTTTDSTDKKDIEKTNKNVDENSYKYVNNKGDSKQYFPETIKDDSGIVMEKNNKSITFAPISEEEINISGKVKEDKITYKGKESGIKYNYQSLTNGVKESIVLDKEPETNEFSFKLELNGLKAELIDKVYSINLIDKKTGKVKGYIDAPNLIDGTGKIDYENVSYKLVEENSETILKVIVDKKYFQNSKLKYPVTIDPTAHWFNDKMSTVMVNDIIYVKDNNIHSSILHTQNKCYSRYQAQGATQNAYLDTSKISTGEAFVGSPADINGKYIEKSELQITEYNYPDINPGTVTVQSAKDTWDPNTITWNNQPGKDDKIWAEEELTGKERNKHILDMTNWTQGIADGSIKNTGLVFSSKEEGTSNSFYGPEIQYYFEEGQKYGYPLYMMFTITYRDIEKYSGDVSISGEYNDEDKNIDIKVDEEGKTDENTTVTGVKIFERKDNSSKFTCIDSKEDLTDISVPVEGINDNIDLRTVIAYSDGTAKLSNIVTLKKTESVSDETETTNVAEQETTTSTPSITYEQTTIDTDGDGLEDGYEIWDFKTLWNTETSDSTTENPKYELDSDGDGFPDSYEVFTLGTDPAIANRYDENGSAIDSDKDGWSDYKEYQEGTDPWLRDSDFDGTADKGDSNPRKTNGSTSQTEAANAQVHKGLYDREYSETEDSVTTTTISNIYNDVTKRVFTDYGDITLNKEMKYFYDADGNNTAIIEAYDEKYDPKNTKTICITYTYDNKNVTYICDQNTKYSMDYDSNGNVSSLKVGNKEITGYVNTNIVKNTGEDGDTSNLENGSVISSDENVQTFHNDGKEQKVKTITTSYKVADDDTTSKASEVKVFYNDDTDASYVTEYNSEEKILNLKDYTENKESPIEYTYTYSNNGNSVVRSDGFTKIFTESNDTEKNTTTDTTSYQFKDLKNETKTYTNLSVLDSSDNSKTKNTKTLFNNDTFTSEKSSDDKLTTNDLYSNLYKKDIYKTKQTIQSDTNTSFDIDIYAEDKDMDYTYDKAGNITKIKVNGEVKYEYKYDAHGRLTKQKDYTKNESHEYIYNTSGNIQADCKYKLDGEGNQIESSEERKLSEYDTNNWPDQLVKYDGQTIGYDNSGNPTDYLNGMKFQWSRGRELQKVTLKNGEVIIYKYNQDGLRTYKETNESTTKYEWNETNLIRETVTYKKTGKTYDLWYFYDIIGKIAGYEYSYLDDENAVKKIRIYYEKNLQGDVIGLLDSRGVEIATYSYDAWGNVTDTICYEGYEIAYKLNHIEYRGYYKDNETGFYYLQSRYYDSSICRFINADKAFMIGVEGNNIYKDNIYIYCNSNPLSLYDANGMKPSKKKYKFKYNRDKVKKYIDKHWKIKFIFGIPINTSYVYFKNGDCANFASQCIRAGGMPFTSEWYYMEFGSVLFISRGWRVVKDHQKVIYKAFGNKTRIVDKNTNIKNLISNCKVKKGDVLYFNSGKGYTHAGVISKVSDGKIYYSAHSKSRHDRNISDFFKEKPTGFIKIYCLKNEGVIYE